MRCPSRRSIFIYRDCVRDKYVDVGERMAAATEEEEEKATEEEKEEGRREREDGKENDVRPPRVNK